MNMQAEEKNAVRDYLLGLLRAERQSSVEERLLTDGAFYEELAIAEDELIDQYLKGELSAPERLSFETHFLLTPERQQKVRFARALRQYVALAAAGSAAPHEDAATSPAVADPTAGTDPPTHARAKWSPLPPPRARNPALTFSLAAAALLLVAAVSWVAVSRRPQSPREPGNVFVASLTPGLVRESGETKRIIIPHDADTVRLRLSLASAEYPTYRAEIQTAESRNVYARDGLKAEASEGGEVVTLDAPAEYLRPGDFQLRLSGVNARGDAEAVGRYFFKVTSR